jgi:DNA polymerase V
MRDAGIFPGDVLIVDRSVEPSNGDVVVAAVDGDFTVKRLFQTLNSVELRPENKQFPLIRVEGETELVVWGVVKRVIHNL